MYGVNTGFGNFADVVIPNDKLEELQENLIRSHSAGMQLIILAPLFNINQIFFFFYLSSPLLNINNNNNKYLLSVL